MGTATATARRVAEEKWRISMRFRGILW